MKVLKVTADNFEDVKNSEKPVLLDFWAAWCGPCQMQGPVIEEAAEKLSDKAVFGKVNVDEESELARQFGVMSIPTLVLLKNGKVEKKAVGFQSFEQIEDLIS